ncbi:ABC transporter ATP-binding protein [Streptomyces sp. NBC_01497]|uniref:ABC transporter ATP-binding protein n=1 Tax=Streptomyces sp. NBC_01497 TaxID=2903885 RepID=UPI002E348AFA|nr:ATP-binding cassette domain-containing protein [Streptomyces sp. NBC_01497]
MITARGLTRQFPGGSRKDRPINVVDGIDISVAPGELVGFLGPNGAGKTTTLRMLTTLLRPTTGEATVGGCDLLKDPRGVRRKIGYVAQGFGSSPQSTVAEELEMQARLYGLTKRVARQRVAELAQRFELVGLEGRLAAKLSGGQRRRLDIAMGLIHRPELIFLDEPTTGLDPQSRANLWDHIRYLHREEGTTVFLTTHYLEEADALCDRILVMDNGRIVGEGSPDSLKAKISGDNIVVEVAPDHVQAVLDLVKQIVGTQDVISSRVQVQFRVQRAHSVMPELLRTLDSAAIPTLALAVSRPTLDDVFFNLTGRSLRSAEKGILRSKETQPEEADSYVVA